MLAHSATNDVRLLIGAMLASCSALRAIWRVGQLASGKAEVSTPFTWDLIAFGDCHALHQLREAIHLHRQDVRVLVVTDRHHFQSAWGVEQSGSLERWEWAQTTAGEAFYNEVTGNLDYGNRLRYRAVRLWHSAVNG